VSLARPLSGRLALVTGAGQRLGRAIAEGLAGLGADVAVHYHASREGADEAVARIRLDGNRAEAFLADLRRPETLAPLVEAVERALGPISVLVNSAGTFERADFVETSPELLERQWALNTRAPYLLTQAVARKMLARGGRADVVNVLDIGGVFQTWRHFSAYTMTKAAMAELTRALALELAPKIRVNAVAPGTVLPAGSVSSEERAALEARIPQGHFGTPADVVAAVGLLLTGPSFMTGQVIAVDGGRSLA
jgi:pteridine reductase